MKKSGYLIKSVVKSIKVLEVFKESDELSTTEISEKLNIPKSTVFNILFTLEELGYIRQIENDSYKLSSKLLELSQAIENDLRNEAKPYLRKLAEKTNETINLVIHVEDKVLYTEKVESTEPININTQVGKREDIYCTAVGKSILAFLSSDRRNKILKRINFVKQGPNTVTNTQDLKRELYKIRDQKYAIDNEEFAKGVKCVAAPIFDHKSEPISAISITGPVERIDSKGEEYLASLVVDSALEISYKLGYSSQDLFNNQYNLLN